MARRKWLSLVLLAAAGPEAHADVGVLIDDSVDDVALVVAVSGQKPIKEFAAEITAFRETLTASKEGRIEKLLGKPVPRRDGDYAMPVGQPRGFRMSGRFSADKAKNKHHTEFYPIGDFAGIEVWYGMDGESPVFALLYFRVDKTFPKLREVKEKGGDKSAAPKKAQAAAKKHTIDLDHWDKLNEGMSKAEVAELFSVPAGDYVPGTEYFTRSWGWRGVGSGKAVEDAGMAGREGADFGQVRREGKVRRLRVLPPRPQPGHERGRAVEVGPGAVRQAEEVRRGRRAVK